VSGRRYRLLQIEDEMLMLAVLGESERGDSSGQKNGISPHGVNKVQKGEERVVHDSIRKLIFVIIGGKLHRRRANTGKVVVRVLGRTAGCLWRCVHGARAGRRRATTTKRNEQVERIQTLC
jgi:hypothetical protein